MSEYLFLKIIKELKDIQPQPILVGGWVPTVYFEFLWNRSEQIIKTQDIDLALTQPHKTNSKTIEDTLNLSQYKKRHLKIGKEKPYQLLFQNNTPIDFLTDKTIEKSVKEKVLGKGIILHSLKNYSFLTTDPLHILINDTEILVPKPERFLIHKMSVYLENPSRKKDIVLAYYTFSRSPQKSTILNEMKKLNSEKVAKQVFNGFSQFKLTKTCPTVLDIQSSLKNLGAFEDSEDILDTLIEMHTALKKPSDFP